MPKREEQAERRVERLRRLGLSVPEARGVRKARAEESVASVLHFFGGSSCASYAKLGALPPPLRRICVSPSASWRAGQSRPKEFAAPWCRYWTTFAPLLSFTHQSCFASLFEFSGCNTTRDPLTDSGNDSTASPALIVGDEGVEGGPMVGVAPLEKNMCHFLL